MNEPQNADDAPAQSDHLTPSAQPPPLPSAAHQPKRRMSGWAIALVVCGCLLVIFLALLLPALAAAKQHAHSMYCVNNLKQVGLAFRIWEGDNGDQFPFNVSTNKGGTLEWCDPGADGLDRNSWRHFQVMSNELSTPTILYCPADGTKQPAVDFTHFSAENVSYLVHSGTNVTDGTPEMVLAICPIHNLVVYCDGSVEQLSKARMSEIMGSLKHPQTRSHP